MGSFCSIAILLLVESAKELRDQWLHISKDRGWHDYFFLLGLDLIMQDYYNSHPEAKDAKNKKRDKQKQTPPQMKGKCAAVKSAARKQKEGKEASPCATPITPKAKSKQVKATFRDGEPLSTEKHVSTVKRTNHCRPADLGRKKKNEVMLAKPGRSVPVTTSKSKKSDSDKKAKGQESKEKSKEPKEVEKGPLKGRKKKADPESEPDDNEFDLGEGDDELDLACPRINRKTHKRKQKKKMISQSVLKLKAVTKYLAAIGIIWPNFKSVHGQFPGHWVPVVCRCVCHSRFFVFIFIHYESL